MAWQVQEAKQHFSELVERARSDGPQIVTKHGHDAVVVMAVEEYERIRGDGLRLVDALRAAPDLDLLELDRVHDAGRDTPL